MAERTLPSLFERVKARLDASREIFIQLSSELVRRNAIGPANGGPGEAEKADFLQEWLVSQGFPSPARLSAFGEDQVERPNLYLRIKGKDSSRCLWLMSHLDVVPAGDLSLWDSDPFVMKVEGNRLIGRGVEDNHQGIVTSIMALKALMEENIEPLWDIGLLFVADEETTSEYGIQWLLAHHSELFSPADSFIVPDAGNEDGTLVEIAEKSILWLRFRVQGKQVHGSTPHLGRNAYTAAAYLTVKLRELYDRFDLQDPIFDPPMSSFEATKKEANVENINTIPGEDVFYMDCRILPQISVDEVIEHIRGICEEIARRHQVTVTFEPVQREDAAPATSADATVVQDLMAAIRKVYNVQPEPKGIGGGTVAAYLRRAGYPAVVWSRLEDMCHQPNEYALLDNLIGDATVFAALMMGQKNW